MEKKVNTSSKEQILDVVPLAGWEVQSVPAMSGITLLPIYIPGADSNELKKGKRLYFSRETAVELIRILKAGVGKIDEFHKTKETSTH